MTRHVLHRMTTVTSNVFSSQPSSQLANHFCCRCNCGHYESKALFLDRTSTRAAVNSYKWCAQTVIKFSHYSIMLRITVASTHARTLHVYNSVKHHKLNVHRQDPIRSEPTRRPDYIGSGLVSSCCTKSQSSKIGNHLCQPECVQNISFG